MKLLNFLKNNLFVQNFAASFVSFISPYLENTIANVWLLKFYITAHDETYGNYLELEYLLEVLLIMQLK